MSILASLLIPAALAQQVDVIGNDDGANNEANQLKLVAINVRDAVAVQRFEFAVSSRGRAGTIDLELYSRASRNDPWIREDTTPVFALPPQDGNAHFADSGPMQWVLLPGRQYALGAYLGDGWSYYWENWRSRDPSFGSLAGSLRTDGNPDSFTAQFENYYYWMRITSTDADVDGDGFVAEVFGGDDCDDADPTKGALAEEIPYDGLDQDCDGGDLVDVDGDGGVAVEAGGKDCVDTDPTIRPRAQEVCGDGIDQDCKDGDLPCPDGTDTDVTDTTGDTDVLDGGGSGVDLDEKLEVADCGCDQRAGGATWAWALLLLAPALRRRR